MDISLAAIEHTIDRAAEWVAKITEYDWHDDADWDPFPDLLH